MKFEIVYEISSLAAGSAVNLGITAPASKYMVINNISLNTSANTTRANLYENISYTEGSAATPVNLNRNVSNASTLTVKTGVTATVSGTPLESIVATTSSGTVNGSVSDIILDQGEDYVIAVANIGSTNATNAVLIVQFTERNII